MNKLTTKKQMPMQTWWALVGARSKLGSKVKFSNFVPFSRLINFVRQRRKPEKKVVSSTQTIPPIKQTEKRTEKVWVLLVPYFQSLSKHFLKANAQ